MAFGDDEKTKISHVMVSLREIPDTGDADILVRMQGNDRSLVSDAAFVAGMSQQKFTRTVLVSASKQVLKEAGIVIN